MSSNLRNALAAASLDTSDAATSINLQSGS